MFVLYYNNQSQDRPIFKNYTQNNLSAPLAARPEIFREKYFSIIIKNIFDYPIYEKVFIVTIFAIIV